MTLTEEQIAEIRARVEAATPGPWERTDGDIWIDTREMVCCGRGQHECCGEPDVVGGQELIAQSDPVNATFIAHARDDIPSLLSALEAANKRAEEAEMAREAMREDRDSQQRVCIAVMAERDALRARVAELEAALTYARDEYDQMIWGQNYEYRKAGERVQEIIDAALKGASHEQG